MALVGTMDLLAWCRLFWGWLLDRQCEWRLGDKILSKLPIEFSAFKDELKFEDPNQSLSLSENLIKLQYIGKQDSVVAIDCKSLFDFVRRIVPLACQEFRTLLQARLIKEHLATGMVIRWIPSNAQVADYLTKIMDNSILREVLNMGKYQFKVENEILRLRSAIMV